MPLARASYPMQPMESTNNFLTLNEKEEEEKEEEKERDEPHWIYI